MENRAITMETFKNGKLCKYRNMIEQLNLYNNILSAMTDDIPMTASEIAERVEDKIIFHLERRWGYEPADPTCCGEWELKIRCGNCRYIERREVSKYVVKAHMKTLINLGYVKTVDEPVININLFEEVFGKNTGIEIPTVKKYILA